MSDPVIIYSPQADARVTYTSTENVEVIEVDCVSLHVGDPDLLDRLSMIASEAAASRRVSLGQRRCDGCGAWTSEPLVEVHSHLHNDTGDLCSNCAQLATGRAA